MHRYAVGDFQIKFCLAASYIETHIYKNKEHLLKNK